MCQLFNTTQTVIEPNFAPSIHTDSLFDSDRESIGENFWHSPFFAPLHPTIPLYDTPSCQQGDKDRPKLAKGPLPQNECASKSKNILPQASLHFHKNYLKNRLEKSAPDYASPKQLFEEIKAKGYQGTLKAVKIFLGAMQHKQKVPKKGSLGFYKNYLEKRLKESAPKRVSAKQLFEEITAQGYRGAFKTMQGFLAAARDKQPEESLQFHTDYLKKRLEEVKPNRILPKHLLEEIKERGYRGGIDRIRVFLSTIQTKKEEKPETSLDFHKGYIKNRLENSAPDYVSTKQLFEEIKERGYQGAFNTLRFFLGSVRPITSQEASLHFHKSYLRQRIKENPVDALPKQLFEEIKAKGYRGTLGTIKLFLAAIQRQQRVPKKGSLGLYKNYLEKRLKESASKQIPSKHLFEEIKAKGYRGALKTMQAFLTAVRDKQGVPVEAFFGFHRDYLKKRLEEVRPNNIMPKQLFEEIKERGYRGSIHAIRMFLSAVRTRQRTQLEDSSLAFQKNILISGPFSY